MKNVVDKQDIVLYTIDDIKRIFKIGRTQAYKLLAADGFPSFKLNKKIYVPKDKLENWINKNCGKTFNY